MLRKQEAGSRKQEAGSRKQEAGSRKQEAGSRLVDRLNSGGCQAFFDELGAILCRS